MPIKRVISQLNELETVDKNNDWVPVVDVSDTTASQYGTTKKALVDQFIGETGAPGQDGEDGREVEIQNSGTYIQWRYVGDVAWNNLVAIADITGETGAPGQDGTDGREVQLQKGTTHIQWKYDDEETWTDLIAISELVGATGAPGSDGEDAYVYIAYASDASGAGFTTTFNADLDYIAIKSTNTEIVTPQASDFAGLWKNYKGGTGEKGEAGSDGVDGDSSYTYIAYASDASGTGFTTTFDANLDYIAIKATTSPIASPQASDFVGLWKKYKGEKGDTGDTGSAATVTVGTTTTGAPGTPALVTNSGTSSAAVLNFTIPNGEDGLDITWRGVYAAETAYSVNDAVYYEGSSYICILASTGNLPTNETYWNLMAQQGAAGEGSGDVTGPDGATDNAIARFDLSTGKIIQNSLVTVDDSGSINIPSGQQYLVNGSPVEGYSDEQAQDAVGGILTDSSEVDFTYDDATPSITASLKAGSIDKSKLDTGVNASLDLADSAIQSADLATVATTGSHTDLTDKGTNTHAQIDSHLANTSNPHSVDKMDVGLGNVDNTSDATKNSATATLTNKTIDADSNTISNLEVDNLKAGVLDTDLSSVSASDDTLPSAKAVKAYVDANVGGGFVWKGPWATSTPYTENDTVESNGSGYVCTSAHTSGSTTEPGVGASWATVWDLFVEGIPSDGITVADLASGVLDTDLSSVSASDDTIPSAKATKTALDTKAPNAEWLSGWIPITQFGDYSFTSDGSEVSSGTKQYEVHLNDGMDLLSYISAGMKVSWWQNGLPMYGIVHKADADAGLTETVLEIFCGTNFVLLDTSTYPITDIKISREKAPYGFPLEPSKWRLSNLGNSYSNTSATTGEYYNVASLEIPAGAWFFVADGVVRTRGYESGWPVNLSADIGIGNATNNFAYDSITIFWSAADLKTSGYYADTRGYGQFRKYVEQVGSSTIYLNIRQGTATPVTGNRIHAYNCNLEALSAYL